VFASAKHLVGRRLRAGSHALPLISPASAEWGAPAATAAVWNAPRRADASWFAQVAALVGAERAVRARLGRTSDTQWAWQQPGVDGAVPGARRITAGVLTSIWPGDPPLSLRMVGSDDRLSPEGWLMGDDPRLRDPSWLARARRGIDRCVRDGLSRFAHYEPGGDLPEAWGRSPVVLLMDDVANISLASLLPLLHAARQVQQGATLLAWRGGRPQCGGRVPQVPDVRWVEDRVSPSRLFARAAGVVTYASDTGFEALLRGTPVTCLGTPFYAGFGLTRDRTTAPRIARSLEQVFLAAAIVCARYLDPDTGVPCAFERILDHFALQHEMFARNRGTVVGYGFLPWKRHYVRRFLRSPGNRVVFARSARRLDRLGVARPRVLVLGHRDSARLRRACARRGVAIERMEDGFLRSVGLGSNVTVPASLVVDRRGLYYDPTTASDLEHLLQEHVFSEDELGAARALRGRLVASGLSKYNVGRRAGVVVPRGRPVVLVPGQVEDDASVRLGCVDVRTNGALLAAVRAAAPGARILFKPHPDVVAGNRRGRVPAALIARVEAQVVVDASVAECLAVCDVVHTMTSLVGFEALLRGLPVVTHGRPFYAGWGLTTDRHPLPRRTRLLSLDELVAGALLLYPRYVDPLRGHFTTAMATAERLAAERAAYQERAVMRVSWARKQWRRLRLAAKELRPAP
jgi:capsular polysaccharide export protein